MAVTGMFNVDCEVVKGAAHMLTLTGRCHRSNDLGGPGWEVSRTPNEICRVVVAKIMLMAFFFVFFFDHTRRPTGDDVITIQAFSGAAHLEQCETGFQVLSQPLPTC